MIQRIIKKGMNFAVRIVISDSNARPLRCEFYVQFIHFHDHEVNTYTESMPI